MSHATTTPRPAQLRDIPLWRLLVALDDAERTTGPDSPTTRLLARHVQERLRAERTLSPDDERSLHCDVIDPEGG